MDGTNLPDDFHDVMAMMGEALHDTVRTPKIAENFDRLPEQLLDRARRLRIGLADEHYGDIASTGISGSLISEGKIMANDNNHLSPVNPNQPVGDPEWDHSLNFYPGPKEILHDFCGENDIAGGSCPNAVNKARLHIGAGAVVG